MSARWTEAAVFPLLSFGPWNETPYEKAASGGRRCGERGGPKPPVDGPRAVRVMQQQGAYAPPLAHANFSRSARFFPHLFPSSTPISTRLSRLRLGGMVDSDGSFLHPEDQEENRCLWLPGHVRIRRPWRVCPIAGGALDSAHSRRSNGLGIGSLHVISGTGARPPTG